MSQVGIIIGREFNERVRKKSFIITTLLMPLLMVGLMFAPMLIMKYSRGDEKQIISRGMSSVVMMKDFLRTRSLNSRPTIMLTCDMIVSF